MTTRKKIAFVAVGYVVALLLAFVLLRAYVSRTSGPDRQVYGGMFACGDSLLFLALFGVASLPATGAALFFLRGKRSLWVALSVAAVAFAATGVAALLASLAPTVDRHSWLQLWAGLSPLRALAAPLFAMVFLLAGLLAPFRSSRITLLAAAASEAAVFGLAILRWIRPFHSH